MEWDSAVLNNDLSMHVLFIHSFFFLALYSLLMKIQECQPKCFPEHTKNILIFSGVDVQSWHRRLNDRLSEAKVTSSLLSFCTTPPV